MVHKPQDISHQREVARRRHVSSDTQSTLALFFFTLCAILLLAMPAIAQSSAQPIPENASPKSYGDGWECDIGFRLNDSACVAISVPENAYKTSRAYGSGWACLHGFRDSGDDTCLLVAVPDGGFLDPSGERWHCLRGYLKVDDTCQEIVLPANAYLAEDSYGSPWDCKRGYEAKDDLCVAIAVPANAYLNTARYGQPWTCERGFFEKDGLCEAVLIPENAYFDDRTYGTGWKCERGFAASGMSCKALEVPLNAHLDRSGNRWECDKNFQLSKGKCTLNN